MSTDEITKELKALEADPAMLTTDAYSPVGDWPDGRIPFVDHHLAYLRSHKLVKPEGYLSNLKLMLTRR